MVDLVEVCIRTSWVENKKHIYTNISVRARLFRKNLATCATCASSGRSKTLRRRAFSLAGALGNTKKHGVFEPSSRTPRKPKTRKNAVFSSCSPSALGASWGFLGLSSSNRLLTARKHRNRKNAVFSSWALEYTAKTLCFRAEVEKTEKTENT